MARNPPPPEAWNSIYIRYTRLPETKGKQKREVSTALYTKFLYRKAGPAPPSVGEGILSPLALISPTDYSHGRKDNHSIQAERHQMKIFFRDSHHTSLLPLHPT